MRINRGYSQRGAFLILVAFLLPLIMAMLGFVIDFGNVYWHKSVLQNCADASSLGGAKAGDKGKTFKKSDADSMADKLLAKNKRYDSKKKSYQYLGSKSDPKNTHYYVVTLTEKVPMYFLKYFGYNEMEIEASCNVKVRKEGSSSFPIFDNLITFSKELFVDQSYAKTFKGNIIHTKSNVKTDVFGYYENGHEYPTATGCLRTNDGAIWPNDEKYYNSEYAVGLDEPQNKELKDYIENLQKNTKATPLPGQNVTTDILKDQVTYIDSKDVNNRIVSQVTIEVNNNFDNNPSSTHILIIKEGAVNLKFNSDLTSKLIIINLSSQQFAIDGCGRTTHLTIYAPNASSVVWNPNGQKFYGSIIAPNVRIQGGGETFTHESPTFPEGTSGSNSSMSLADDEDIAW